MAHSKQMNISTPPHHHTYHHIYQHRPNSQTTQTVVETAVFCLPAYALYTTSDKVDGRDQTQDKDRQLSGQNRLGRTGRDKTTRLGRDATSMDVHIDGETVVFRLLVRTLHVTSDSVDGRDETQDTDGQLAGRNCLGRTKRDNTTKLGQGTTDTYVHVEDKTAVFGLIVYVLYIPSDSVSGRNDLRDEDKQPNGNNYPGQPRQGRTVRFGRDTTGIGVHLTDETAVSLAFVYSLTAGRQDQNENTDLDRPELYRLCPTGQGGDT